MDRIKSPHLLAVAVILGLAGFGLPRLVPGGIPAVASAFLYATALMLAFVALLRGNLPEACDTAPPTLRRRYTRELMLAMAAYVLVLFASVWLLRHVQAPALRALVALAPLPPIALALRAIVRYIRDADEMQQRIELEAVCLATAFVSLLYMGGGFLQKLTEGASILGLFVMGALVNKWTHVNIPLVVSTITGQDGQTRVTTVQTILDQLMPGLVPLLLTFACMWLLRKKVNPLWIIVGFFVIGIAGYAVGLLGL